MKIQEQSIEQYNKELEEANQRIENGEFCTAEEVENKFLKNFKTGLEEVSKFKPGSLKTTSPKDFLDKGTSKNSFFEYVK